MTEADYWAMRWNDSLKGKDIVTRYLVAFGFGHYDDFCGVKEIKGFYDKNFDGTPVFYQIDKNESYTKLHKLIFCFETQDEAQKAYNENVHMYIEPLQRRIDNLTKARL